MPRVSRGADHGALGDGRPGSSFAETLQVLQDRVAALAALPVEELPRPELAVRIGSIAGVA